MNIWTIYAMLLGAAAIQGLTMGILLWRKDLPAYKSNRFLSLILFFFSYRLLVEFLKAYQLGGVNHWTYHVLLEYNWVHGTLIFFYVRSYLNPDFRLGNKEWIHFLPVGLEFIFSNWVKIQNFYWDGSPDSLPFLGSDSYILWVHTPFQIWIWCCLMIFYVRKSQGYILAQQNNPNLHIPPEYLGWLRQVLWTYLIFSIIVIITSTIDYFFFSFAFEGNYRLPTYIGMAIITYWMGLQAFSKRQLPPVKSLSIAGKKQQEKLKMLGDEILSYMQKEKPYLNPALKVSDLAESLEVPAYQLTQCLNGVFNQSFSDFINSYRIDTFKQLLQEPNADQYTLMALAFESGFNSKATFNRAVKKLTGKSPTDLKSGL